MKIETEQGCYAELLQQRGRKFQIQRVFFRNESRLLEIKTFFQIRLMHLKSQKLRLCQLFFVFVKFKLPFQI